MEATETYAATFLLRCLRDLLFKQPWMESDADASARRAHAPSYFVPPVAPCGGNRVRIGLYVTTSPTGALRGAFLGSLPAPRSTLRRLKP